MGIGSRQVVVYLSGVGDSVQALAHCSQRARDEVGGALPAHAKHHGGAHVKGVALSVVVPRAAAGYDIPAMSDRPDVGIRLKLAISWAVTSLQPEDEVRPGALPSCQHAFLRGPLWLMSQP